MDMTFTEVSSRVLETRFGIPSKESHHITHNQLAPGRFALNGHVGRIESAVIVSVHPRALVVVAV